MNSKFACLNLCTLTVFATAGLLAATASGAGPFTYDIDQDQSNLNLTASGTILGGALEVTEQFPGDVTEYGGTIEVEFPSAPWSGSPTITFPGGSNAAADVLRGGVLDLPRNVSPGIDGLPPSAPANYGLDFLAPLDIELPDIPLPPELGGVNLPLGTLTGVQLELALRDVVWDVQNNTPGGLPIDGGNEFDASGGIGTGVQLGLTGGFADLSGSLVLTQDSFIAAGILEAALNVLASSAPELGLSVSRPDFFSSDVLIGIGTRVDLGALGGNLLLPNGTTDPGLVTLDAISNPGFIESTLILPIDISLGDFGLPPEIIDLDLGFDGQFVATSTFEVVPEPTSGSLLVFAAVGFIGTRTRRRRSA